MHKQLLNEIEVGFELEPDGPILIKASDNTDPTRPDMEFVRTRQGANQTIYLPGSSLKGAFRAHYEKLVRSVPGPNRATRQKESLWACNPLARSEAEACGHYLDKVGRKWPTAQIFRESCFVCQLFGNNSVASHLRISDALPTTEPQVDPNYDPNPNRHTEQRNGVAIDRLFGSVAVGPFQFEVTTAGRFTTTLQVRNFTVAHLGLLGLVLRDLEQQRLLLGFGKSRGLGRVRLHYKSVTVRYPMANLSDSQLVLGSFSEVANGVYGIGALASESVRGEYGLQAEDRVRGPYSLGPGAGTIEQAGLLEYDALDGVSLTIKNEIEIKAFWRKCAEAWQRKAGGRVA
ncbi:MAG: CRISPR-associated protein [Chloroflexi bacterium]|nr:CRISPR-associated protein [Chloroflexota bacterium]